MNMSVGLYCVYDKKSKLSGPIYQARTVDEAKRMIISSLHETSVLVQFPDDYTLMHVADFGQIDCTVEHVEGHFVCSVRALIPEKFRQFDLTGGASDEKTVKSETEKS